MARAAARARPPPAADREGAGAHAAPVLLLGLARDPGRDRARAPAGGRPEVRDGRRAAARPRASTTRPLGFEDAVRAALVKLLNRTKEQHVANSVIADPEQHTTMDASGAVRSIQAADLDDARGRAGRDLDADAPRAARAHVLEVPLARHARADPRRVHRHRARGRAAAPAVRAAALPGARVRDAARAAGSCAGRSATACSSPARAAGRRLPGDRRQRCPAERAGLRAASHVEVEVANFYPALATWVARWFYANTQSRIHVLVTHGFLRSLARLELEESAVGRFAPQRPSATGAPARRRDARQRRRHAVAGVGRDRGRRCRGRRLPVPALRHPPPAARALAVAVAGQRAQLAAVVARLDPPHGARAAAHHQRLGASRPRAPS